MREQKLRWIIEHYGKENQLKYFQTEIWELNQAIFQGDKDHITEEIADVLVMLEQFIVFHDIDPKDIESMKNYKIDRQIKRIEAE